MNIEKKENNRMEIPIYLFTGFIESGKTTVIKDTLMQPDFVEGAKTLLILCEEGEEEYDYDYFKENQIDLVIIEEQEKITETWLQSLDIQHEPDQIVIEYNGTWDIDKILEVRMPKGWAMAEIISTVDASAFEMQLKNMRTMIMEQIFDSDLIIFNRCNENTPKANFRRIIKAINRKAQIIYELESGEIDNSMKDILPFDTEKNQILIEDDDYGIWYLDAFDYPEKYINKELMFKAIVYRGENIGAKSFIPGRFVMTCCEDDVSFFGYLCKIDQEMNVKHRDWVQVTVEFKFEYVKEYKKEGPVLYLKHIEPAEKPMEELVYLN